MLKSLVFLLLVSAILMACHSDPDDPVISYPHIGEFLSSPSDQFLVDIAAVDGGHPFKGLNANTPHIGAHVHFDNTGNTWPLGGINIPENYPPVYAVADGTIHRVETYHPVGPTYRYGVNLSFASSNGMVMSFEYSIESMIDPGDSTFYEPYILVSPGQKVIKGDVIAYMYIAPNADIGTHIHFHINDSNGVFYAPAIFTSSIVTDFHARFGIFAYDGVDLMPACMGYKLVASENPFGTGAADCL